MEQTTEIVRQRQTRNYPPSWHEGQKESETPESYFTTILVKMAHGHDTITEHPMHGQSQACVNTLELQLPPLGPRPNQLFLQSASIKIKLPLASVPAYPLCET